MGGGIEEPRLKLFESFFFMSPGRSILLLRKMNSKVTEEVSLTVPSSNTPSTRKPTFLPSQNWTSLQKSLPKAPSKKRKREAEHASKKSIKSKNPVKLIKQTTYNPWRPNDSSFRGNGNPALILHTESTDKIVK